MLIVGSVQITSFAHLPQSISMLLCSNEIGIFWYKELGIKAHHYSPLLSPPLGGLQKELSSYYRWVFLVGFLFLTP